ncbi:DCD (development and cell death) domain protein [Trifolium medium]|uniref:DCD (Development and cell death) domain protein n=1 Tax=Trifolium medium TaxID=97028 RepID=A0A392N913_9FABA|nr:DCD (development and cell death) domain protein [Trifolium medium]
MEGTVTNTRKRKLNAHRKSVTAEQEVQELILSPKSWVKCESIIHFDDDAYDPENPGFNQSWALGHTLLLAMNHSSFLHCKRGKETSIFLKKTRKILYPYMIAGNDVSSIPVPRFLLSNEEYNRINDSSSVAVSDLQSKDESDHLNSLLSKGSMYSDDPKN